LTKQFPPAITIPQFDNVKCCAIVLSAGVIDYLAVAIENLCQPMSGEPYSFTTFLQIVNIAKNLFTKSSAFDNAIANINDAAEKFTIAITDLAAIIGVELLQQNEKILGVVESIKEQMNVVSDDVLGILKDISKLIISPQARSNYHMDWRRWFH
jgi:hypothetical protein